MSKRVKFNFGMDGMRKQTNQATPGKMDTEYATETDTQAVRLAKEDAPGTQGGKKEF